MFPHQRLLVSVNTLLLFFLDDDLAPPHFIQEGVDHQLFFSAITWRYSGATEEPPEAEATGTEFSIVTLRRTLESPVEGPDAL